MQSYRVFIFLPKFFSRVLVPLDLEPIHCSLSGYAANLFLCITSMQRLVLTMETCMEVRSFVRPCFLWFAYILFAFLFLQLFVVCFIVCRFCRPHQTICSVNFEVVSKFDAAKVVSFSLIKSSSK